jgi:hypothetical protein
MEITAAGMSGGGAGHLLGALAHESTGLSDTIEWIATDRQGQRLDLVR